MALYIGCHQELIGNDSSANGQTSVQMCSSAVLVITHTLAQHQQMKQPGQAQEGLAAHVVN